MGWIETLVGAVLLAVSGVVLVILIGSRLLLMALHEAEDDTP